MFGVWLNDCSQFSLFNDVITSATDQSVEKKSLGTKIKPLKTHKSQLNSQTVRFKIVWLVQTKLATTFLFINTVLSCLPSLLLFLPIMQITPKVLSFYPDTTDVVMMLVWM